MTTPPKPETIDIELMVGAVMNIRTAGTSLVQLHNLTVTGPEHQKAIDDLGGVIHSQQTLLAFLVEHYISLAELMDQVYDRIINATEDKP